MIRLKPLIERKIPDANYFEKNFKEEDYTYIQFKYSIISGLGILRRFQRKRIATALALAAWKQFFKNKVRELRCEVYKDNKSSLTFIKSLGFVEYDLKVFRTK